ncbi:MAG: helix-turn-helix transcriptional regulator [Candidatus Methylomirabilales bacterium]
MSRAERLVTLLELLRNSAALEAEALARACGVSVRTLSRDLEALRTSGFPVFYDHGYRLAFPALLPPITFTANEALTLRLAARSAAPRAEPTASQALDHAAEKLQQALAALPPAAPTDRQLALALPVQDPRADEVVGRLAEAVQGHRTVKIVYADGHEGGRERRLDPYQLIPSETGQILVGYAHDRRRLVRVPLARLAEVSVTRRRFRPLPERVLQRHLRPGAASPPEFHKVRILGRPPLALPLRKHPPAGALMWEEAPGGCIVFTLATLRLEDLVPWLLACGGAVEVLEPARLRQEVLRAARAIADRHAGAPTGAG